MKRIILVLAIVAVGTIGVAESAIQSVSRGINPKLRYDQACYLTGHNAYSNTQEGWSRYKQQNLSVPNQLAMGVRALMLDIYDYENDVYLCHQQCGALSGLLQGRGQAIKQIFTGQSTTKKLSETLRDIVSWIRSTPVDSIYPPILTVFFENYVQTDVLTRYVNAVPEFRQYLLTPQDWNVKRKGMAYH